MILANENEETFSFFAIVFLFKPKKSYYNTGTAACNLCPRNLFVNFCYRIKQPAPFNPVFIVETMIYQPYYVTDLREMSVTIQRGFFKKVNL